MLALARLFAFVAALKSGVRLAAGQTTDDTCLEVTGDYTDINGIYSKEASGDYTRDDDSVVIENAGTTWDFCGATNGVVSCSSNGGFLGYVANDNGKPEAEQVYDNSDCLSGSFVSYTCPTAPNPTTSPSPTAPNPTYSPTKAPWEIKLKSTTVDFTEENTGDEVILQFDVPKGRQADDKLYAGGCAANHANETALDTDTIGGAIYKTLDSNYSQIDPRMKTVKISYKFNRTMIATSEFWNNDTNMIELCQEYQLVEATPGDDTIPDLIIVEHLTNITIDFNLFANFSIGVNLTKAVINAVNGTSDLDGYISAYHCEGDDDMNELAEDVKLKPNDELAVCILSSDADVEINQVSMAIKGKDTENQDSKLDVMEAGAVSIPAITSYTFVNDTAFMVQTMVPIGLFDFQADDAKIDVVGSVKLNLKGEANPARELSIASAPGGRRLQTDSANDEAGFDVAIGLEAGAQDEGEGIAAVTSAAAAIPKGLAALFAASAAYGAWY